MNTVTIQSQYDDRDTHAVNVPINVYIYIYKNHTKKHLKLDERCSD